MPNRLVKETSPYLLQHAHNPVDWYPWGPEALDRAKAEDKPILLSVGYSSCHWCHVMERESFENNQIAEHMNKNFVCIKVDREERPDIDSIYMAAVQAMTGQGGWPMTVFLTPGARPFYGGTYYPPEDRHGIPGFPGVLEAVARAYRQDPDNIARTADRLVGRINSVSSATPGTEPLTADAIHEAYRQIAGQFDSRHGDIGAQPKFPQPMTHEFLLRYYLRSHDPRALEIVDLTLDRMAAGGIYDQVGGGFHRYSTDRQWLVPHFEKMLYDNALLVKLYLHAYQVTAKPLYRRVVQETLTYVHREMTNEAGGFHSAQDADSDGVEGSFFVWSPAEIIAVLGKQEGELFNRFYGVKPEGNFEGRSILHVVGDTATAAREAGLSEEDFDALLQTCKASLLQARERRGHPERDDKALTAWNGLMLRAFAEAGAILDRPDYTEIASRNANFVMNSLRRGDRLLRAYKNGKANLNGFLEDYAFLIDGFIALHEAAFEQRWLREAIALGNAMVGLFWDEPSQQFYDTARDHETLIVRPRAAFDNALPSGSSMATDTLLRLAVITGEPDFERRAATALRSIQRIAALSPSGAGHWLCALDFYLSTPKEIAIIGDRDDSETRVLAAEVYRQFLPNRVFLGSGNGGAEAVGIPLLEGRRKIDRRPTAYVCRSYACQLPVTEPVALAEQLTS